MIETRSVDTVEIVLQCDEQLQFIEEVIARSEIPEASKNETTKHLERIKSRQKDSNLYLAVVGEFSSGKSTFINALLKDDLLKTSHLVATAAATKIVRGNSLTVQAKFSGAHPVAIAAGTDDSHISIPWLPEYGQMNLKQFVHTIATAPEVARDVVDLTIHHPASFLANGVVIIDTPGTNAADNPEHVAITKRVVEEEADLAIVAIPATIILSQTLANFLTDSLKPYLHRCLFVVTCMDKVRSKEHSKVLQSLRARLVDKLDIAPPILYACSAQIALDLLNGEEIESQESEVWGERFAKLEEIIMERLKRERTVMIVESLLRLLNKVFETLDTNLRSQWQNYEKQRLEIQQQTIPNLSDFAAEQYKICDLKLKESISTYLSHTVNRVDFHRELVTNYIRTNLFGKTSEDALKDFIQLELENFFKEDEYWLQNDLQPLTQNLAEEAIAVGNIFDLKFAEVYRRLKSLGGKVEADSSSTHNVPAKSSNAVTSAKSLTQKLDSNDGTKMGLGATAGILVGTILLPGVGTVVGIAVGSWVSRFFTPSLEERKQKLWEQLLPSIDSYFDTVKIQTQEAATNYAHNLEASLKKRIDSYIEKYQSAIDSLLKEQNNELERLNKLQELTKSDLSEIERRQKCLSRQQQKLAIV